MMKDERDQKPETGNWKPDEYGNQEDRRGNEEEALRRQRDVEVCILLFSWNYAT
jgi:hypothetical protein